MLKNNHKMATCTCKCSNLCTKWFHTIL